MDFDSYEKQLNTVFMLYHRCQHEKNTIPIDSTEKVNSHGRFPLEYAMAINC